MYKIINDKSKIIDLKRGFTLVELLIVMAVMTALSAGGIVSFLDYSRTQIVNQAANDFASTVNLAKLSAQSQVTVFNKPIGSTPGTAQCVGGSTFAGYSVNVTGASTYGFYMTCTGMAYPPTITVVTFPVKGVAISPSSAQISFGLLSGGVVTAPSSPLNITFTYFGKHKTVTVDASGGVNIHD